MSLSLSPHWTSEPQTRDVFRQIKYSKFNDSHEKDRVDILIKLMDISLFFFFHTHLTLFFQPKIHSISSITLSIYQIHPPNLFQTFLNVKIHSNHNLFDPNTPIPRRKRTMSSFLALHFMPFFIPQQ